MRVLVTGSGGLVGKEVISALKQKKHKIIEFDLVNGKSILNENQLLNSLKGIDAVIHLAGIIENENPSLWKINVEGTQQVTSAAIKSKVKKLIFMSSTAVYGNTKEKVDETTQIDPENDYEKSKVEGEKIVLSAKNKLGAIVIRSAMVFGPNEYWRKMFHMLEKDYPLPCSGKNTFQVVYTKELARAIVQILTHGENGEIYLVSGKEKKTLNEFCEMVQKEMGIKIGVKHIPTFIGILAGKILRMKVLTKENIRHLSKERNYDISKLEKTGYKQKISLEKAIKEVIDELNKKKK
jgi:UDP-glucose 4-epimerase